MIFALVLACTAADDRLSYADAQVVGTHNSYHVATSDLPPWVYDHPPLEEQVLDGVRQFEIDVYWDGQQWNVYHVAIVDEGTSCATVQACMSDLERGSAQRPNHLPLVVLVEPKTSPEGDADEAYAALTQAMVEGFGDGRILPSEIDGAWPVLAGQRGRVVPVLHSRDWAQWMTEDVFFRDGYGDLEAGVVHSINDPFDARIAAVVEAGHLVRTRTDANVVEPAANDVTRRDQALASGAHFLSTDYPTPHPVTGFVVDLGGVARCNPVRDAAGCTASRLEADE